MAAAGIAAAGALIITKPHMALTVVMAAAAAMLVGYLAGWANDEWKRRHDHDDFSL